MTNGMLLRPSPVRQFVKGSVCKHTITHFLAFLLLDLLLFEREQPHAASISSTVFAFSVALHQALQSLGYGPFRPRTCSENPSFLFSLRHSSHPNHTTLFLSSTSRHFHDPTVTVSATTNT
jgi:hypothetical protein